MSTPNPERGKFLLTYSNTGEVELFAKFNVAEVQTLAWQFIWALLGASILSNAPAIQQARFDYYDLPDQGHQQISNQASDR